MILNLCKAKSITKFLERKFIDLKHQEVSKNEKVTTVGIIFDSELSIDISNFYVLTDAMKVLQNDVFLLGYVEKIKKDSVYTFPIFSKKAIGWKAKIKDQQVLNFCKNEYDVLLNFFNEDKLPLLVASALTKTNFRVGFETADDRINDLIIKTPIENFSGFKTEVIKYLTILKKI